MMQQKRWTLIIHYQQTKKKRCIRTEKKNRLISDEIQQTRSFAHKSRAHIIITQPFEVKQLKTRKWFISLTVFLCDEKKTHTAPIQQTACMRPGCTRTPIQNTFNIINNSN